MSETTSHYWIAEADRHAAPFVQRLEVDALELRKRLLAQVESDNFVSMQVAMHRVAEELKMPLIQDIAARIQGITETERQRAINLLRTVLEHEMRGKKQKITIASALENYGKALIANPGNLRDVAGENCAPGAVGPMTGSTLREFANSNGSS
jgi:hypothetical protein